LGRKTDQGKFWIDNQIEMDANSFSNDLDAIQYVGQRGGEATPNGIAFVCRNDIGKEAFAEKKVTKIILKNQPAGKRSLEFDGSSLIVSCAFASSDDFFREAEIRDEIENKL
jgi:hypothetical protein